MKLNVLERLMGLQVLDSYKEGNFITLKTLTSLKNKLLTSEEEVTEFGLKIEGNNYSWNAKGNESVEIEITEGEEKLIKNCFKIKIEFY
jgi:membrane-bound inhibitor of C-type lysozyme